MALVTNGPFCRCPMQPDPQKNLRSSFDTNTSQLVSQSMCLLQCAKSCCDAEVCDHFCTFEGCLFLCQLAPQTAQRTISCPSDNPCPRGHQPSRRQPLALIIFMFLSVLEQCYSIAASPSAGDCDRGALRHSHAHST